MNWVVLNKLNKIYKGEKVKINESLLKDSQIKFLIGSTEELVLMGDYLQKGKGFEEYYENNHLDDFDLFDNFLVKNSLKKPQTRFQEEDIKILIGIKEGMDNGELLGIRNQIIAAEETVRGVSSMFFENEKYLEKSEPLINAVKQLLKIKELANDKDQQYKYVLECASPQCIVLCENLDFLKRPSRPRKHNIELWYAGGKNVAKLEYSNSKNLPIYYSCDWDYDGLFIIYPLVRKIIPNIKLLYPTSIPKNIERTKHKSIWKTELDYSMFQKQEIKLIKELILSESWVIEEKNDLLKMIEITDEYNQIQRTITPLSTQSSPPISD